MIKEYQKCTILWHFVAVFPLKSLLQAHWWHSAASSCCYTVTSRLLIGPATHFGADSLRWAVNECFQDQCQQNHTCIYTSIVKKICIQTFSSSSRFIWAIEAWNQIVKSSRAHTPGTPFSSLSHMEDSGWDSFKRELQRWVLSTCLLDGIKATNCCVATFSGFLQCHFTPRSQGRLRRRLHIHQSHLERSLS